MIPNTEDADTNTTSATVTNKTATAPEIIHFSWSYTTLSIVAHIIMIFFALTFLLLPMTLVYLLELTKGHAVSLVALFCLLFCLIFFVFGRLNTDHKFILLFAYTGVMTTLLSNMGTVGVAGAVEGAEHRSAEVGG